MASKIQIINRALSRLAQARITSLDDNTQAAKLADAIYDQVAEDIMARACWPSVLARASLAQDTDTPTWGFDYQYQLPTDPKCLRVIKVNEGKPGIIEYKIEGNKLLTDESTIDILYISFIDDTESYDSDLRQAITWGLVAEMVYPFAGQQDAAAKLADMAEKKIESLVSLASLQGSREIINSDDFVDARYE